MHSWARRLSSRRSRTNSPTPPRIRQDGTQGWVGGGPSIRQPHTRSTEGEHVGQVGTPSGNYARSCSLWTLYPGSTVCRPEPGRYGRPALGTFRYGNQRSVRMLHRLVTLWPSYTPGFWLFTPGLTTGPGEPSGLTSVRRSPSKVLKVERKWTVKACAFQGVAVRMLEEQKAQRRAVHHVHNVRHVTPCTSIPGSHIIHETVFWPDHSL